jgi:predicted transcriptional regulator
MDNDAVESLRKIGFTEGESKAYLALLSTGTSTIGPIVEKANVSTSKIYIILNRLIDKGIVSMVVKDRQKLFSALEPETILDFLDQESMKINSNKEDLKKMMPRLKMARESSSKLPIMEMSKGVKGFENFYREALDKSNEEPYQSLAGKNISFKMQHFFGEYFLRPEFSRIEQNMVYENEVWYLKDPGVHKRSRRKLLVASVLPKEFKELPNVTVFGKSIILSHVKEGEVYTIIIRDKGFAESFSKLLQIVRKSAQKPI